jgi:hypothetical protein
MRKKDSITHCSHSSFVANISSKGSYLGTPRSSPQYTCNAKNGFAWKSGWVGCERDGGNRSTSLKSIEFSEGGFHLILVSIGISEIIFYKVGAQYDSHVVVGSCDIRGS